ncbi:zinc finger protein 446 isoform X2 [Oryctolagus cuniculus]|uniref:zinc finger protein 446 isoform X2 n=1 Tax=Oryctolagus cuniculus TaxID=9986 RepID=UPI00387A7A13
MPSPLGAPPLSLANPDTAREEPEAARLRFRGFCYREVAGPREALARLRELCRQWLQPDVHSKEQMLELLVLEQLLGALPPEIQAWVQAQRPGSPEEAVALVEGLQRDPGQLLGWITAHVLKQELLPAAQKTEESSGSPRPSGTVEPPGAALGEGPQDARMQRSAQLSHSVKEEPDADGQELAPHSTLLPAQSPKGHLGHGEQASTSRIQVSSSAPEGECRPRCRRAWPAPAFCSPRSSASGPGAGGRGLLLPSALPGSQPVVQVQVGVACSCPLLSQVLSQWSRCRRAWPAPALCSPRSSASGPGAGGRGLLLPSALPGPQPVAQVQAGVACSCPLLSQVLSQWPRCRWAWPAPADCSPRSSASGPGAGGRGLLLPSALPGSQPVAQVQAGVACSCLLLSQVLSQWSRCR